MAERVQVIVDAKDNASGVLRGITQNMGALGSMTEQLTGSSINWGNVAQQAYRVVSEAVKDAVKVTVEYDKSVRDLALASGGTAEEASRLIQVLDDFEISATDINTAVKALTKQGLAPTVETIAKLSDQYNALNTAQEKNEFIIKNLGRGGLQWANALKEGGDALRALNEDVNANLILTDETIQKSEDYRLALDDWNDAVLGLKVSLGNGLLPILTDLINSDFDKAMIRGADATGVAGLAVKTFSQSANGGLGVMSELVAAADKAAQAFYREQHAFKAAGDAAEEAAKDNKKLLDMTMRLNDATAEQIKQLAYQDLYKQLSEDADGLTSAERDSLNEIGKQLGIFDQKAIDSAQRIEELNQKFADGVIDINNYSAAILQIPAFVNTTVSTTTAGIGTGLSAGGGPLSCFIAGTLIEMADGKQKAIEDVMPGDVVVSVDTETGNLITGKVEKKFIHTPEQMGEYYLMINNLGVTPNHKLYFYGWVEAGKLKIGDTLVNIGATFETINSIEKIYKPVVTYDLHIDNKHHNYFAGGILVHNKAEGGWIGGSGSGSVDSTYVAAAPGEFMVNARAARENAALLEAINNGGQGGANNYFYGNTTFMLGGDASGFMEQR